MCLYLSFLRASPSWNLSIAQPLFPVFAFFFLQFILRNFGLTEKVNCLYIDYLISHYLASVIAVLPFVLPPAVTLSICQFSLYFKVSMLYTTLACISIIICLVFLFLGKNDRVKCLNCVYTIPLFRQVHTSA